MVNRLGVEGFNDREFVSDFRGPRVELRDPVAGATVLGEFIKTRGYGQPRLAGGHAGENLAAADGLRQVGVEEGLQAGLVIPGLELRRRAGHEKINGAFGFGRKVRQLRGERGAVGGMTRGTSGRSAAA